MSSTGGASELSAMFASLTKRAADIVSENKRLRNQNHDLTLEVDSLLINRKQLLSRVEKLEAVVLKQDEVEKETMLCFQRLKDTLYPSFHSQASPLLSEPSGPSQDKNEQPVFNQGTVTSSSPRKLRPESPRKLTSESDRATALQKKRFWTSNKKGSSAEAGDPFKERVTQNGLTFPDKNDPFKPASQLEKSTTKPQVPPNCSNTQPEFKQSKQAPEGQGSSDKEVVWNLFKPNLSGQSVPSNPSPFPSQRTVGLGNGPNTFGNVESTVHTQGNPSAKTVKENQSSFSFVGASQGGGTEKGQVDVKDVSNSSNPFNANASATMPSSGNPFSAKFPTTKPINENPFGINVPATKPTVENPFHASTPATSKMDKTGMAGSWSDATTQWNSSKQLDASPGSKLHGTSSAQNCDERRSENATDLPFGSPSHTSAKERDHTHLFPAPTPLSTSTFSINIKKRDGFAGPFTAKGTVAVPPRTSAYIFRNAVKEGEHYATISLHPFYDIFCVEEIRLVDYLHSNVVK